MPSRRVFKERILREAGAALGDSDSLVDEILELSSAGIVTASSILAVIDPTGPSGARVTASTVRDYVLGITAGVALIPEVTGFGIAPPATAADSRVTITRDGNAALQIVGYGSTAGVRNLMASGTQAAPTAISVAGVSYIGFLGGAGYDGTTWQTGSAGLFGIKPAATWSGTSRPTLLSLETTPVGSTGRL